MAKTKTKTSESSEATKAESMRDVLWGYVKSGKSGLYITSFEETRVEADIAYVAKDLKYKLYAWSVTQGLVCPAENAQMPETEDPVAMLDAFQKCPVKSIVLARDLHMFLGDAQNPNPVLIRKIKDTIKIGTNSNRVLAICGCRLKMPAELEKELAVVEFKLPDRDQLNVVLEAIAGDASVKLDGPVNRNLLLDAACGLTTQEAADAFAMSVAKCGDIKASIVAREKAMTVKRNGVLEIVDLKPGLNDIGGLEQLKDWLGKRKMAFSEEAQAYGLPIPKGVLLIGVPGAGKSLTAKATATIFDVPLLKLDAGKLFGSLVGESESLVRCAIQTAEAVAPSVLWVEELDKSFSGSKSSGQTDGGTSARVFSTFLQWLQEKTSRVFVVATANDVTQLPPELLRKGWWDEMFMVDLPNKTERIEIWKVL